MSTLKRFSDSIADEWANEFEKTNKWDFYTKQDVESYVVRY